MSTELTITPEVLALRGVDESTWSALKNSIYPGAKDESVLMAVDYCRARQLDPLMKPVHLVPMSVKDGKTGKNEWRDVVMPGVGLYRIQADRSGNYAGASEPVFGPLVDREFNSGVKVSFPEWCKYSVFKRMTDGKIVEFVSKEYWIENYATAGRDTDAPNSMWKKRPYAQLAKCCEAQALRKAWPEIGQQPTAEEMEGKTLDVSEITEREINPAQSGTQTSASSLNRMINAKTTAQQDHDTRDLTEMLSNFTEKMSHAGSVEELDLLFNGGMWPDGKKRPGAMQVFSGDELDKARDVYQIRKDEMLDVPL